MDEELPHFGHGQNEVAVVSQPGLEPSTFRVGSRNESPLLSLLFFQLSYKLIGGIA